MFVIAGVSLAAWFVSLRAWLLSGYLLRKIQKLSQAERISNHSDKTYDFHVFSLTTQTAKIGSSMCLAGTLANVLPLLGLLGTVLGMLMSFEVIQTYGRSQPQLLAGGISQALITTQAGLWTALPVFFFHHIIKRRMRLINNGTEILLHVIQQTDGNKKFSVTPRNKRYSGGH